MKNLNFNKKKLISRNFQIMFILYQFIGKVKIILFYQYIRLSTLLYQVLLVILKKLPRLIN